jgi:uncharacterized protein
MRLDGQRVLVTGASSGIGREIARASAARGALLALAARREDRLEALADELADAAALAETARARLGGVDVLVNNAGSGVGGTVFAVGDATEARTTFEVDVWSSAALIAGLVPSMRAAGTGAVVNVTSVSQATAYARFGFNSAAKAALGALTETLRLELVGSGVHVVQVVAGPTATPSQAPMRLVPGAEETLRRWFGEIGDPRTLAGLVVTALEADEDFVFYPPRVEEIYRNPVDARAAVLAAAKESVAPADESLDSLVMSVDHPFLRQMRDEWERDHAAT